jgi:hypothetical protein
VAIEEISSSAVIRMPLGGQTTNCTLPPETLCHYIRDDELERIGEMRDNLSMQICLAAIGIFFGSATPAFDGLSRLGNAAKPLTATDMVSIAFAFASLAVAVVTAIQWGQIAKRRKPLLDTIRERPRIPVRIVGDNTA